MSDTAPVAKKRQPGLAPNTLPHVGRDLELHA